jgi:hypothetical protein
LNGIDDAVPGEALALCPQRRKLTRVALRLLVIGDGLLEVNY